MVVQVTVHLLRFTLPYSLQSCTPWETQSSGPVGDTGMSTIKPELNCNIAHVPEKSGYSIGGVQ